MTTVRPAGTDGHFVPHKDTPRGSDMIGTLVVCLPSQFSRGDLVLTHRGIHKVFDWAEEIRTQAEPSRLHWAAFFGDVQHEIQSVWSGLRVTLSYILRRGVRAVDPAEPSRPEAELLHERLIAALADRRFLPGGGVLAFPCFHLYGHEAWSRRRSGPLREVTTTSVSKLKGRDQQVARAALAAGLKVSLQPYLVESCADETWQLERFPEPGAGRDLGGRVEPSILEDVLAARPGGDLDELGVTWVEPAPRFNSFMRPPRPRKPDDAYEAPGDEAAIEQLHACEYSATGYFGNEGSDTEFYVYAALQVEWPARAERQCLEGPSKRGAPTDPRRSSRPRGRSR